MWAGHERARAGGLQMLWALGALRRRRRARGARALLAAGNAGLRSDAHACGAAAKAGGRLNRPQTSQQHLNLQRRILALERSAFRSAEGSIPAYFGALLQFSRARDVVGVAVGIHCELELDSQVLYLSQIAVHLREWRFASAARCDDEVARRDWQRQTAAVAE